MTSLTQTQFSANAQPLIIGNLSIRQDEEGRYSLADLHKASGNLAKHKPSNFLRVEQTQELINEIEQFSDMRSAVKVINGGNNRGTYAVKEMVYSYAMWISAKFHLMVIRAYDAMVMQTKINTRQVITPEQKDTLQKIVDHKVNGNQGLRAQVWTRHNRHFKINSYHELLVIHFEDAVKYLLEMDVKQKVEKQEVKTLPYPQQVIHVAQEINNEFEAGRFDSWFVMAKNGVLSVMPLPHGYYPFNVKEFTKHFDGVLNVLYGSDALQQGRFFLASK